MPYHCKRKRFVEIAQQLMWNKIANLIMRKPIALLVFLMLATTYMGFQGKDVKISYEFLRILPTTDSSLIEYRWFQKTFGEVSNTMVLAIEDDDIYDQEFLLRWNTLMQEVAQVDGVRKVFSATQLPEIIKNDSLKQFELFNWNHENQKEDLAEWISERPFYDGIFISEDESTILSLVQLENEKLYNEQVITLLNDIKRKCDDFAAHNDTQVIISGIPYIRMGNVVKIKNETYLFIGLAILVTSIILLLFLKSFKAMLVSLLVVVLGVIWSFGLIKVFGFEITLLSSLIPPLVIVIGVPNCIFFINKYHNEFKIHKNKVLALQRTITKIGNATLLTNTTTALGFATFIFTNSEFLYEFGVVASINIMVVFVLCIVIIPALYIFLQSPTSKHYKHFDRKWLVHLMEQIIHIATHKRPIVYGFTVLVLIFSIWGMTRMQTSGRLTDDLSKTNQVYKDIKFLEKKFKGVEPIEIVIDAGKPRQISKISTLKKIDQLQAKLVDFDQVSRSISVADLAKYAKQAYYNNDPGFYKIPNNQERNFIFRYVPRDSTSGNLLKAFVDSTQQYARITLQVADLGTEEMQALQDSIRGAVNEVLGEESELKASVTGASVVFLKGTHYLIKNLAQSLTLAIILIALIMAFLFRSWRMVLISMLPNIIPLLFTAGMMGWLGIPIKPSTILVFSIAFGISVDDTIHFLAKYRQELKTSQWNIGKSVNNAIREIGVSMFYTSVILFCGFSIFMGSGFGGTVALGILVAMTLFVAIITNLILLPSMLLSLEKLLTNEEFAEPPLELIEEEIEAPKTPNI